MAAACTPATQPSSTPSSNQAHTPFTPVTFPVSGLIAGSPDGRLFAVLARSQREARLFTLDAHPIASVSSPSGDPMLDRWLPDSSGLLVWPVPPQGGSGHLTVIDADARVESTGLPGGDDALSPSGAWLAATEPDPSGAASIVVTERHTSTPNTVARGRVRLLGWSASDVIYTDDVDVYAVSPIRDGRRRIVAVPAGSQLGEPELGASTSPDGQVTLVRKNHLGYLALAGDALTPLPAEIIAGPDTVFWSGGGHDALGLSFDGRIVYVDVGSGKVTGQTLAAVPRDTAYIEAISGDNLEWESLADHHAHVTSLRNGKDHDLGRKPEPGLVMQVSGGRFLLAASDGHAFVFGP
jgi:hypothetical protein